MNIYRVTYFDGVSWVYKNQTMLAESEAQVRATVDESCRADHRLRQYGASASNRVIRDSLKIELEKENVGWPYILSSVDEWS